MTKRTLTAIAAACVLLSAGRPARRAPRTRPPPRSSSRRARTSCARRGTRSPAPSSWSPIAWIRASGQCSGWPTATTRTARARAWGEFKEAMNIATRNRDAREKVARERSNKLEPTLSKMTIVVGLSSQLPGMVVKRDNVEVGQTLWGEAVPVDPGSHTIAVSAPRKKNVGTTVQVIRGVKNVDVHVPALEDAPRPCPWLRRLPSPRAGRRTRRRRRVRGPSRGRGKAAPRGQSGESWWGWASPGKGRPSRSICQAGAERLGRQAQRQGPLPG